MNAPPPPTPAGPPHWATTIAIPTTWTPEQALAVFELLDNLPETVAALYLDHRLANPGDFAHVRQELGIDPPHQNGVAAD